MIPKETITERVKLERQKTRTDTNLHSKQTFKQTSSLISRDKSLN